MVSNHPQVFLVSLKHGFRIGDGSNHPQIAGYLNLDPGYRNVDPGYRNVDPDPNFVDP